jgi:hypothetical protein
MPYSSSVVNFTLRKKYHSRKNDKSDFEAILHGKTVAL